MSLSKEILRQKIDQFTWSSKVINSGRLPLNNFIFELILPSGFSIKSINVPFGDIKGNRISVKQMPAHFDYNIDVEIISNVEINGFYTIELQSSQLGGEILSKKEVVTVDILNGERVGDINDDILEVNRKLYIQETSFNEDCENLLLTIQKQQD